jgi:hypothetical protein
MYTQNKFNYISITNNVEHAKVVCESGINQIMIDIETIGKPERQLGKNAVINFHSLSDIFKIKSLGLPSDIICRVNPFNEESTSEINSAIIYGADHIMIPMIDSLSDFERMLEIISGRCKVIPLIETPHSFLNVHKIIDFVPLEQIHFGLNDLCIGFKQKNIFEILFSKTFHSVINEVKGKVKILGIGGVGSPLFSQLVDPKLVLKYIHLLGGNSVILSRSFFKNGYNKSEIKKSISLLENELSIPLLENELSILNTQINKF